MKKHTAAQLNELFSESESVDKEVFAEMRSNILLISGDHYTKKGSKFWKRIQDDKQLNDQQKLRLTKNHIQKIVKIYSNHLITASPGVMVGPQNEKELKDQKAAEMHQAVWVNGKQKHNLDEKTQDWADDLVGVAEVHTKLYFDPTGGDFVGYEQELDPEGAPVFDEDGSPKASEKAVFKGQVKFEPIYGFNLLRCPTAKTLHESPYLIVRKMVDLKSVLSMIPEGDKRRETLAESADQTFVVFDAQSQGYRKTKGQVMLKEFYFRKCPDYPNGYWYFQVGEEIIAEGEIPFGLFPIVSEVIEKYPTAPRGRSPVKTMRPYQIEINRAASKIAEHQITLGDDKLIMSAGSKLSQGSQVSGVRGLTVTGAPPTILAGRDGSQYLGYMQAQIEELYSVMMVEELQVEKNGQLDPYAMLFRSASQKQKFNRYVKRFERFLKNVCELYLELQRNYLEEDDVIYIVGKSERVNISEYKNTDKLCYQIKLEAQSDDIETKLGKQLVLNHLLQYTSGQLGKEEIGKIYRLMPYGNNEEIATDLTMSYDNATNMILALDRGELPEVIMEDDKNYMIKRLMTRKRQADFRFLDPMIKSNYDQVIQQYQQLTVQEMQAIKAAQSEFIPAQGALIGIDFYVTDPATGKTRRAKVPFDSAKWLLDHLEQQGTSFQQLEALGQAGMAGVANQYAQGAQMGATGTDAISPNAPAEMGAGVGNTNAGSGTLTNLSGFNPRTIAGGTSPG